jgi:hypothetical protein
MCPHEPFLLGVPWAQKKEKKEKKRKKKKERKIAEHCNTIPR